MRNNQEILADARRDIQDDTQRSVAPLWLEYRKLEVLIDIRDVIRAAIKDIQEAIWNMPGKD